MIALRDSPFCTSRKILHNFFLFPPDTSAVPGDIEDNAYAKLGGGGGGIQGVLWEKCKWQIKKISGFVWGKKCAILTVKVRTLLSFFFNEYHEPLVFYLS